MGTDDHDLVAPRRIAAGKEREHVDRIRTLLHDVRVERGLHAERPRRRLLALVHPLLQFRQREPVTREERLGQRGRDAEHRQAGIRERGVERDLDGGGLLRAHRPGRDEHPRGAESARLGGLPAQRHVRLKSGPGVVAFRGVPQDEDDLALDVEPCVVVVGEIGRVNPVAREDDFPCGCAGSGERERPEVFLKFCRPGAARQVERERVRRPRVDLRDEREVLEERAAVSGGHQPQRLEPVGDELGGHFCALGAGEPTLECVGGEEVDVVREAPARVVLGGAGRPRERDDQGRGHREQHRQLSWHRSSQLSGHGSTARVLGGDRGDRGPFQARPRLAPGAAAAS